MVTMTTKNNGVESHPGNTQQTDAIFLTNTLKRNTKIDKSNKDLIELLGYLEGELEARDVVIASLKMEQVKHMLSRAKYGWSDVADPVIALQRDSEAIKEFENENVAVSGIYGNQLAQLEHLISTQRVAQEQMRDQLIAVEKQYHKTCAEFEDARRIHEGEIHLAESVTCLLEKDRDRFKEEAEFYQARCKQMELELSSIKENFSENKHFFDKHRQVALMLLRERSRLITKLLKEREHSAELERVLKEEREKSSSLEESQERHVGECEQLCVRLATAESLNRSLQQQLDAAQASLVAMSGDTATTPQQQSESPLPRTILDSEITTNPQSHVETVRRNRTSSSAVPTERWPVPNNRNIAASRLRTVLSAAIEGSTTDANTTSRGPSQNSSASLQQGTVSPRVSSDTNTTSRGPSQNSSASLQQGTASPRVSTLSGSKLPQVPSLSAGHSVQRSGVLPPTNITPVAMASKVITGTRLAPLLPSSSRVTPPRVTPSLINGSSYPVRPLNSTQ